MAKEVEFEAWAVESSDRGLDIVGKGDLYEFEHQADNVASMVRRFAHVEAKPVRVLVCVSVIGEGEK